MAEKDKARYWTAVLYPENMIEGWEDRAADVLQLPFAYCVHDADHNTDGEDRKTHVHFILAFPNTTTYSNALSVFRALGEKAVNKCERVRGIRYIWDYLIHDTDSCRKAGKHLYEPSCRITGNNFDIGSYEQLSTADKEQMLQELCEFVVGNSITNMADLFISVMDQFGGEYFTVFHTYNALLDRMTRGAYLKQERMLEAIARGNMAVAEQVNSDPDTVDEAHENGENHPQKGFRGYSRGYDAHESTCPNCGSNEFVKRGKTASDQQRYLCKNCGKTFV